MDHSPGTRISRRPSLIGPVFLIAMGVVFLIGELVPEWGISRTWPVLLIVIGILLLLNSSMPPRPPQGPRL